MQTAISLILLLSGLVILFKSADILVSGSVALARAFNIPALIVGLTIVAMGTSAPELAASIAATLRESGNIAMGNVYGSNIANLALVGGASAIISPILVSKRVLRYELPVMTAAALLLLPFIADLHLSRIEGFLFLGIFIILIILTISRAARDAALARELTPPPPVEKTLPTPRCMIYILAGLIGLAVGADITVRGAVRIGTVIGLSEAVIGMTIIAIGTSLPELFTCVVAAVKGHDEISIGNLVGSNIFNTLLVTGTAAVTQPFSLQASLAGADYWIMIGVCGIFIAMAAVQKKISRFCGVILLILYLSFLVFQVRGG